jgi:type I restriction enzyme S subunit
VDNRFLFYQIALNKERYKGLGIGSTFLEVNKRDTEKFEVLIAPEPQQLRIAEILSTLDEAIEQTEALIAKMQQVKAGLMHDLFTRGVTPEGYLRLTREQAPDLYKESLIGWIPKEWEVGTIQDVVSPNRPIVYGILMPGSGVPGGIPVIKVKDIVDGDIRTEDLLLTSPEIDAEYQRSKLRAGDILLTIRGSVGRLARVPEALDGANITQDTARIGIVRGLSLFYRFFLETDVVQEHFAINTLGQAVQGINLRDVRATPVIIPCDCEQEIIAERVELISNFLKENTNQVQKLRQQKQGLMQDLLTGRVRVPEHTDV